MRFFLWGVVMLVVFLPSTGFSQTSAEQLIEQRAVRALHGAPAIDIRGNAIIAGSPAGPARRLTDAYVHNAAELALRKNGIPITQSCDGGTDNCGRLSIRVLAACTKSDLVSRGDSICSVQVIVQYLEQVMAIRSLDDPEKSFRDFAPVWEHPPTAPILTTEKELDVRVQAVWNEALNEFSLYYLRANPAK